MDPTDQELLRRYVDDADREAFGQLVHRHAGWVHSAARRLSGGLRLEDDVTQAVFILLSRKASSLHRKTTLSSWLFAVTRYCAGNAVRNEMRRRKHERQAAAMKHEAGDATGESANWDLLAPLLDELVGQLRETDRQAVLLRFYQQKTFVEIGTTLRMTEEAARKRVSRAIDQLRGLFARRGVTVGAAALAGTMSANLSTHSASAAAIASAVGSAQAAAPVLKGVNAVLWWMALKPLALAGAALLSIGAVALVVQVSSAQRNAQATPTTAPAIAQSRFGTVLTPAGKPVPGARVWQIQYSLEKKAHEAIASTVTDGHGRFQIPLVGERANLLFKAPGFAWSGGYIRSTDGDDPDEVRLEPATKLSVKFTGPDNKPSQGVGVKVAWTNSRNAGAVFPEGFDEPGMSQVTDADGVCSFVDLAQGSKAYLVMKDQRFVALTYVDEIALGRTEASDGGVIRLKPGASISGRVVFGDAGKPASGIAVRAESELAGDGNAVTDSQGRYEITQLPADKFNVTLDLSEQVSQHYGAPVLEGVAVVEGMHLQGQDLTLVPGGIVRGRITEQGTGQPLAGMKVWVAQADGPDLYHHRHLGGQATSSDADGFYLIHATPGARYVQFWSSPPPGFSDPKPSAKNIQVVDGQAIEMNFELAATHTSSIKGRTVDANGRPVGSVEIYSQPRDESPPGNLVVVSDAAGNFSLPAPQPGSSLRARRGRWTTIRPTPATGQNIDLVLQKDAFASIRLVVQQPDGKPMAGAIVRVSDRAGNEEFAEEKTGADGICMVAGLNPDLPYSARIDAAGFGTEEINVQVQPAKQTDVKPIVLTKADSVVAGMVVDETGNPLTDVTITMMARHYATSFKTDLTGHFRYQGLVPSERVSMSATKDDHTLTGVVKNVPAGTDDLVITLHVPPPPATRPR